METLEKTFKDFLYQTVEKEFVKIVKSKHKLIEEIAEEVFTKEAIKEILTDMIHYDDEVYEATVQILIDKVKKDLTKIMK